MSNDNIELVEEPSATHPVQVFKTTTISGLNDQQASAYTMEKALRVMKIQTKQELTQQIAEQTKLVTALAKVASEHVGVLRTAVLKRVTAEILKRKDIQDVVKVLGALLGSKMPVSALIKKISLSSHNHVDGVFKNGRVGVCVGLAFDIPVLANTKETEDVEDDGIDHRGRRIINRNDWWESIALTAPEKNDVAKWATMTTKAREAGERLTELQERLSNVGNQAEALESQILTDQILQEPGGKAIVARLKTSLEATVHGKYLALL